MRNKEGNKQTARVLVAADIHYIAPELITNRPLFLSYVEKGDGKLSEHSEEIADAFVEEVVKSRPDALILAGDLTYNGEKLSLVRMAEKLRRVKEAGIPVFTIPGNHDICYPLAISYAGESIRSAVKITDREFRDLTKEYGVKEADASDRYSTSYLVKLTPEIWFLLLDANSEKEPGALPAPTLRWAEKMLREAQKKGAEVIAVSHQNVVTQNTIFKNGFIIKNHRETADLFRKYGVKTVLSAHAHMTHHEEEEGLTDYCTGALSVWPLAYAELTVSPEGTFYESRALPIRREEAEERFDRSFRGFLKDMMKGIEASGGEQEAMLEFAVRTNRAYFSGTLDAGAVKNEEGFRLWKEYGSKTFYLTYLKSIVKE